MKLFLLFLVGAVVLHSRIFQSLALNLARNERSTWDLWSCGLTIVTDFSVSRADGLASEDSVVGALHNFRYFLEHFYGDGWGKYCDYGNYCGFNGGNGGTNGQLETIEDCDSCCKTHDDCYGEAVEKGLCYFVDPYWWPYTYDLSKPAEEMCSENEKDSCAKFICECDLAMARRMGQLHQNGTC